LFFSHSRATGDKEALDYAIRLFKAIEQYSFDPEKNGYMEVPYPVQVGIRFEDMQMGIHCFFLILILVAESHILYQFPVLRSVGLCDPSLQGDRTI